MGGAVPFVEMGIPFSIGADGSGRGLRGASGTTDEVLVSSLSIGLRMDFMADGSVGCGGRPLPSDGMVRETNSRGIDLRKEKVVSELVLVIN
jgi:hypothetical protein